MKVLRINRLALKLFGLSPASNSRNSFALIVYNIFVTFLTMSIVVPSLAVLVLEMKDASDASDILYICSGSMMEAISFVLMAFQKSKIAKLINDLQSIVNKRSRSQMAKSIYERTNERVEFFCKWLLIAVSLGTPGMYTIGSFLLPAIDYLLGKYSMESWNLPYRVVMPYDSRTPIGYGITLLIHILFAWSSAFQLLLMINLYVGFCRYSIAFVEDITSVFDQIDEIITEDVTNYLTSERRIEVKQLTKDFASLYSGIIFTIISLCTVAICGLLYQIKSKPGIFKTLHLSSITFFVLGCIFLFCQFGDNVTQEYLKIASSVYQRVWYLYPMELQKNLVPVLLVSQTPIYISGLSIILCSLESFTALMKTTSSYFMVLLHFD